MNRETLFATLESITNLPTLPEVMHRITAAVRDPDADAEKVAKIIKDDPSMTARVLKVVNSAAYSKGEPIVSIQQAVSRMGFVAVQNIALSTSLFSTFPDKAGIRFSRKEFWRHSVCVGIGATVLYKHVQDKVATKLRTDVLHLAGLLHDIGKIILEQFFHQEFAKAIQHCQAKQIPLFHAERELFGADHTEIGAWLAAKWKLSKEAEEIVRCHHDPEQAVETCRDLARICHTANYICNLEKIGNGGDSPAPMFHLGVWKRLGLSVRDIQIIVEEVNEESKYSETLLAFMGG